jgi:hypothetical protein
MTESNSADMPAAVLLGAGADRFDEQRSLGMSTIAFKVSASTPSDPFILENTFLQASTLREQTQTALLPAEREAFEQVVATARAALDEPAFAREWNTGTTRTQDEAIDDALSDGTPGTS